MLKHRVIPSLLLRQGGLVKTQRFRDPVYVGDPINAIRIFNEKEVDELMVVDIDATREGREPDYTLVRNLASECRMPLCYGGGIQSVEQFQRLISVAVEKVAVSSAAVKDLTLVTQAAERVGRQSVVVVVDVRREGPMWRVYTHNGTRRSDREVTGFVREAESAGAGEIVVNSIDNDGLMKGFDLELARAVRAATTRPLTVLGGAGRLADIEELAREFGVIGAAAGSLFVFKGAYRAVLINYPRRDEKDALLARARS